jgi:hypothetical protein
MKPGIIRWIALIAGSGLSIAFVFAAIFVAGSFIGGVTGDAPGATPGIEKVDSKWITELICVLTMFLIPLSVVLAWFRIRTGAYLLTLFAAIHIIACFEPEIAWMQIAILPIGPLLMYYVSYKKRFEKKERS